MIKIKSIKGREILSSGATPSLEVKVVLSDASIGVASVPFGASAGIHEATVLFDGDKKRYGGKGMLKAVNNINKKIAPKLIGQNPFLQKKIDQIMIYLDGTPNKSKLGGNAILGVSLAVAKASAQSKKVPFYKYIRQTYRLKYKNYKLPKPMIVVIEGGKHAVNSTDLQEYMITPVGGKNIKESVRIGAEVYLNLKKVLHQKNLNANVGNEGAYAPAGLKNNESPWLLIMQAIKKAGYKAGKDVMLSADPAVSEIFENGKYNMKKDKKKLSSRQMIDYFKTWVNKYPLITLEDPLAEDDWDWWPVITKELGKKVRIVGDDLTVTNPERLKKAIDLKAINAILIKLNQIGSLSETVQTIEMAHKVGFWSIVSHRGGGETNDTSMIDLAVATNSEFVKVGISRGERVSKYNRLMEIEDEVR
ncbi:phosphopyruvate hydratase [Patescibacteria group bacterium]|nr:phosphopyruvate hydratase [Patescibacteria group bacterium]